eukprot:6211923-Pleurochrysis_carterae.AAC.1
MHQVIKERKGRSSYVKVLAPAAAASDDDGGGGDDDDDQSDGHGALGADFQGAQAPRAALRGGRPRRQQGDGVGGISVVVPVSHTGRRGDIIKMLLVPTPTAAVTRSGPSAQWSKGNKSNEGVYQRSAVPVHPGGGGAANAAPFIVDLQHHAADSAARNANKRDEAKEQNHGTSADSAKDKGKGKKKRKHDPSPSPPASSSASSSPSSSASESDDSPPRERKRGSKKNKKKRSRRSTVTPVELRLARVMLAGLYAAKTATQDNDIYLRLVQQIGEAKYRIDRLRKG